MREEWLNIFEYIPANIELLFFPQISPLIKNNE